MSARGVPGMLLAVLAGCTATPDYHPPAPDVPARWSEAPESGTPAPAASPWWTNFSDAELVSLVGRALRANPDLQLAEARVRETRARRGTVAASLWPSVDATASLRRERESRNAPAPVLVTPGGQFESVGGSPETLYQAGFDATWELDLFGGRRRSVEAAQAELESAVYDRGAVLLTLLAEVARNYIELRGVQQQIAVARVSLAAQQDALDLGRARYAGGMATDFDVARAEAQVQQTASQIPALETSYKETVHRLGILLGEPPGALAEELLPERPIPGPVSEPPLGLPSDLLRQRPDLQRAERQLAAATARLGAAKADLYPRFSLLGTAGLASVAAGNFFDGASILWSIGPSMTWPIFRGGQIVATIEVRDAQKQQALIAYRKTILAALEDAENAIAAYRRERDRRGLLADAVSANQRAVDLARGRYIAGLADFRDVLDAERGLFQAQSDQSRSDAAVSLDLVALHKALGGGWDAVACRPPSGGEAKCSTSP